MGKYLFIAEKPSVARQFAECMNEPMKKYDGYQESEHTVVTWCFGHLVTMSYPEKYDENLKKWRLDTLPFIPENYKYEVIESGKKQFEIVKGLLNRDDVSRIYVCTDSGREGEYIYRLVRAEAGVRDKDERRVWINSQTEEEIKRGVREAKDLSSYDDLSDAAYLRAIEDYLMGINFSRLLTIRYGNDMASFLHEKYCVISVGRVMTCVLGMVVKREREIRSFTKTPFYRVVAGIEIPDESSIAVSTFSGESGNAPGQSTGNDESDSGKNNILDAEWKVVAGSKFENSPLLYKENGFKEKDGALSLISYVSDIETQKLKVRENGCVVSEGRTGSLDGQISSENNDSSDGQIPSENNDSSDGLNGNSTIKCTVNNISKKKEKKNAPLLYNLAEIQSDASKMFKISPEETLKIIQDLYEKRLVTYPRTDARVLSTAIAKEIDKNIKGLAGGIPGMKPFCDEILSKGMYKGIEKTRYTDDSRITDHYAIIPTGQGFSAIKSLDRTSLHVYEAIVRRFLAIFYPPAVYEKLAITFEIKTESFFSNTKELVDEGYMKVMHYSFRKKKASIGSTSSQEKTASDSSDSEGSPSDEKEVSRAVSGFLMKLKRGQVLKLNGFSIKEGETQPPKRYTTGSMILAMENAGNLIEDESLREQIKSQGIGTSATRADILNKLVTKNKYLSLNKKTQILTPTLLGEMVTDCVALSIHSLLNPSLTASWEKGLSGVADGEISYDEYMKKLKAFIVKHSDEIKNAENKKNLMPYFRNAEKFYRK